MFEIEDETCKKKTKKKKDTFIVILLGDDDDHDFEPGAFADSYLINNNYYYR